MPTFLKKSLKKLVLSALVAALSISGFTTFVQASTITFLASDQYGFTYWRSEGSSAGTYEYRCDVSGNCEEYCYTCV